MSMALAFDVGVVITPAFKFSASTIWPGVNRVENQVEQLESADDAMIASLLKARGKLP